MRVASGICLGLILVVGGVQALLLGVEVPDVIDAHAISHSTNHLGYTEFTSDLFNSGSVAYHARMRLDIFNETQLLFTGWGEKQEVAPGNSKGFMIYWPHTEGTYSARLRFYAAHEIIEENRSLIVPSTPNPEEFFTLYDLRTHENTLHFSLHPKEPVHDVVIIPSSPTGWVIEQKKIPALSRDTEITLSYETDRFEEKSIVISVFTQDGRYFGQKEFVLKKEQGIRAFFADVYDGYKYTIRSLVALF